MKTNEDGTSDIVTVGQRVFFVLRTFDDEPYTEASIRYLNDEAVAASPGAAELSHRLWSLCVECHKLLRHSEPDAFDPEIGRFPRLLRSENSPRWIWNSARNCSRCARKHKRQSRLADQLAIWIPTLTRVERTRTKAAGNGHGHY